MRPSLLLPRLALAVSSLFLASLAPAAVVMDYSNTFDTNNFTNNAGFTNVTTGGGSLNLSVSGTSSGTVATGSEQFSNAAGTSYVLTLSTRFTAFTGTTTGDATVAIALFGTDGAFGGGTGTPYLQADWTFRSAANDGRLRFVEQATAVTTLGTQGLADQNTDANLGAELNTDYVLRLEVLATGANAYDLTLSLRDSGGALLGTAATLSGYTPVGTMNPSGWYMGVRTRVPSASSASTALSVTEFKASLVPEPGAAGLLGLVFVSFLLRRRR
jgi:hypothetical protein